MDTGIVILILVIIGAVAAAAWYRFKGNNKNNTQADPGHIPGTGAAVATRTSSGAAASSSIPTSISTSHHHNHHHSEQPHPSSWSLRNVKLSLHQALSRGSLHSVERTTLSSLPNFRAKLGQELGTSALTNEWVLLYSSSFCGRSFPRLVSAMAMAAGPALIVLQDEKGGVFGGVTTESRWLSVKQREQDAQFSVASRERDDKLGKRHNADEDRYNPQHKKQEYGYHTVAERPEDQAAGFFGASDCFVFKTTVDDDAEEGADFFQPRTSGSLKNSNFMMFYDQHPMSDHVGIGMGGSGERGAVPSTSSAGMAWWLDRSFHGSSSPGGCNTFQGCYGPLCHSSIGDATNFHIATLEVWSLNPLTIGDGSEYSLYGEYVDEDTGEKVGSALKAKEHRVEMSLMQMNGATMYSEREDIATADCDRTGCRGGGGDDDDDG